MSGTAKRQDRRQTCEEAARAEMGLHAIPASLVVGSRPEWNGRGLGFVEDLSSIGGVAEAAWFDGEQ